MSSDKRVIPVGSRKSQLAMIQTNHVCGLLKSYYEAHPEEFKGKLEFEIKSMSTIGDRVLDQPLPEIGEKSLFTRELEVELLNKSVDFVVHSLKDLPTILPEGCTLGGVIKRDSPDDVMVLAGGAAGGGKEAALAMLTGKSDQGSSIKKIGSSSHRRISMIKRSNPRLECTDIRGNLNTRFAKLDKPDGEYGAIILASAGLTRMGWESRETLRLAPDEDPSLEHWLHAVGQGAIAIECRQGDVETLQLLEPILDLTTTYEIVAERSLMRKLEAGCSVPLGVRCSWLMMGCARELTLKGIVLSKDGVQTVAGQRNTVIIDQLSGEQKLGPDEVEKSAYIGTQSRMMSDKTVLTNLLAANKLGLDVADMMIKAGCMELL